MEFIKTGNNTWIQLSTILRITKDEWDHATYYQFITTSGYVAELQTPKGTTLDNAIKQALVTINLNKDTDDKSIHTESTLR